MFSLLNLYSIYFPFLNYSIKLANYNSDLDIKFTYKWTWICYGCQLWRLIRKKKKLNCLVRILFYHWLCNTPFSALHNWHCISCLTAAVSKHSVSISYKYQLRGVSVTYFEWKSCWRLYNTINSAGKDLSHQLEDKFEK